MAQGQPPHKSLLITFHVSRSRGKMHIGHGCVSVCLSVPRHIPTTPRTVCKLGEWYGCPLVVHCWVDLQSVHGFLCYDNIAVCVSVCLSLASFPHYCMDPDVTWGNGRGCHPVVHYWADLQSVHGFRCYDNIAANTKCQRVRVLDPCLISLASQAQDL